MPSIVKLELYSSGIQAQCFHYLDMNTAQKIKFSIKDLFSKYNQIRRKLRMKNKSFSLLSFYKENK